MSVSRTVVPGASGGVLGTSVIVLLPPAAKPRVASLWEAVDDGAGFDEVLDALISGGLRGLPGFVLVSGEGREVKVVIRGAGRAELDTTEVPDYRVEVVYGDGVPHVVDDAYRYLPTLGEMDLHLINEGRHEQLWDVLGSHVHTYDSATGPVVGTSFAVWAPHAKGVRLKEAVAAVAEETRVSKRELYSAVLAAR